MRTNRIEPGHFLVSAPTNPMVATFSPPRRLRLLVFLTGSLGFGCQPANEPTANEQTPRGMGYERAAENGQASDAMATHLEALAARSGSALKSDRLWGEDCDSNCRLLRGGGTYTPIKRTEVVNLKLDITTFGGSISSAWKQAARDAATLWTNSTVSGHGQLYDGLSLGVDIRESNDGLSILVIQLNQGLVDYVYGGVWPGYTAAAIPPVEGSEDPLYILINDRDECRDDQGVLDRENVLVHEIGHLLGLHHTRLSPIQSPHPFAIPGTIDGPIISTPGPIMLMASACLDIALHEDERWSVFVLYGMGGLYQWARPTENQDDSGFFPECEPGLQRSPFWAICM